MPPCAIEASTGASRKVGYLVMAGHSRLKDGVASARLCPAIHVFCPRSKKNVDARDKRGHDG
jgi:hypothetical protein